VQLKLKIYKFSESYLNAKGEEPSIADIAFEVGLPPEKVEKILKLQLEVDLENFETFVTGEEDGELEKLEKEQEHSHLVSQLSGLTVKEKIVIGLQYGILSKID